MPSYINRLRGLARYMCLHNFICSIRFFLTSRCRISENNLVIFITDVAAAAFHNRFWSLWSLLKNRITPKRALNRNQLLINPKSPISENQMKMRVCYIIHQTLYEYRFSYSIMTWHTFLYCPILVFDWNNFYYSSQSLDSCRKMLPT